MSIAYAGFNFTFNRYCVTKLNLARKKSTKKIETTTPIPFDQAWFRAYSYKKVGVVVSIEQGPKKSESEGAENGPFPHIPYAFEERFDHPGKTWASATHRQFSLEAVAVATANATYSWVESEARRVLREVLGVREKERRQEVTPPVACARRARVEVSDDDDDDDDDDNRVGVGAAA